MKQLKNKIIVVKAYESKCDKNGNHYNSFLISIYNKNFKNIDNIASKTQWGCFNDYNVYEALKQFYKIDCVNDYRVNNFVNISNFDNVSYKKVKDFEKYFLNAIEKQA